MIYYLQKKVIRICGIAVLVVFSIIFLLIYIFSTKQLNETMDALTDRISDNDGKFPEWRDDRGNPELPGGLPDFMTMETPFSTRFFTVLFDEDGKIVSIDLGSISAITEETAREYAGEAYTKGGERGWTDNYRYKQYYKGQATAIVYVDGSMNRFMSNRMVLSAGIVLVISARQ